MVSMMEQDHVPMEGGMTFVCLTLLFAVDFASVLEHLTH